MFEILEYTTLQEYWWIIIALLGALLVAQMFVQGGQTLVPQIATNDTERDMLINSIGRRWDVTFTTLVTFGGAFFAAFPLFYSTSFGGAYWVWIIILFSFVIQAVSYEFRTKPENFLGRKTFDSFLVINGIIGTILIGAAVGTFFTGSEFSMEKMRIAQGSGEVISQWETPYLGLEAALNITNLALGLSVFFLSRILGLQYFMFTIKDQKVEESINKKFICNSIAFLLFFLGFLALIFTQDGFAVKESGEVFMQAFKYFINLIEMPIVFATFLIGVLLVLYSIYIAYFKRNRNSIWYSFGGVVLVVLSLFLIAGFNNTAYYPSTFNLQHSLTIRNSSSSPYTLIAMSYVSLIVPFVVAYIAFVWRALSRKQIDASEMQTTHDKY